MGTVYELGKSGGYNETIYIGTLGQYEWKQIYSGNTTITHDISIPNSSYVTFTGCITLQFYEYATMPESNFNTSNTHSDTILVGETKNYKNTASRKYYSTTYYGSNSVDISLSKDKINITNTFSSGTYYNGLTHLYFTAYGSA